MFSVNAQASQTGTAQLGKKQRPLDRAIERLFSRQLPLRRLLSKLWMITAASRAALLASC